MIVFRPSGGTGNQLFQYACARAVALNQGQELYLDPRNYYASMGSVRRSFDYWRHKFLVKLGLKTVKQSPIYPFGLKGFNIRCRTLNIVSFYKFLKTKPKIIKEEELTGEPPFLDLLDCPAENIFLKGGYWQSEKYFRKFASHIRQDLIFRKKYRGPYEQQILSSNAVSLHIRRGDYEHIVFGFLPIDYYQRAVAKLRELTGQALTIFVFSNDLAWCRDNLPKYFSERLVFVEEFDELQINDLYLMSLCRYNIVANSSYSWWGAWLNQHPEKIVIAPQAVYADGGAPKDYWPAEWIKI